MPEPLEGIRVVEMGTGVQGPAAAGFLADMGADVIRVEPPWGCASRFNRGVDNELPEGTTGAMFIATSRGKRSLCLDIRSELGLEAVYRLAARADVFISNYREHALVRLGLGYEELRSRNPKLIYAVASGFGDQGPDADKGMVDGAAQARGGIISVTGEAGGPPLIPGALIADTAGAMQLALGVMTALVARERHGVGQQVAVSAYGAQIWLQMWEITQSGLTGTPLRRQGAHHPNIPGVAGVYETADGGFLFLANAQTEAAWQDFWSFAGAAGIALDPRWNSVQKRNGVGGDAEGKTGREIQPHLARAFKRKTTAEWVAFLDAQPRIIYSRVYDYDDVLNDPQALANGYIVEREIPQAGRRKGVGNLIHLSATPATAKDTIPELGQDTEFVLLELGFTWEEVERINADARRALQQKFSALGQEPPL